MTTRSYAIFRNTDSDDHPVQVTAQIHHGEHTAMQSGIPDSIPPITQATWNHLGAARATLLEELTHSPTVLDDYFIVTFDRPDHVEVVFDGDQDDIDDDVFSILADRDHFETAFDGNTISE